MRKWPGGFDRTGYNWFERNKLTKKRKTRADFYSERKIKISKEKNTKRTKKHLFHNKNKSNRWEESKKMKNKNNNKDMIQMAAHTYYTRSGGLEGGDENDCTDIIWYITCNLNLNYRKIFILYFQFIIQVILPCVLFDSQCARFDPFFASIFILFHSLSIAHLIVHDSALIPLVFFSSRRDTVKSCFKLSAVSKLPKW